MLWIHIWPPWSYCDSSVTFPHKAQHLHRGQMREQEAELTLRSLYGSAHPQGDTVCCPDTLKLVSTLQDDCLAAPSISSAAYCSFVFTPNLAECSFAVDNNITWQNTRQQLTRCIRELGREMRGRKELIKLHIVGPATGKKEAALCPLFKLQMIHSRQKMEQSMFAWQHFPLLTISAKRKKKHTTKEI